MTATLNWLTSAGLLTLGIGFAYREWEAWRSRRRELRGLLYLLDLEVSHNLRSLSLFAKNPDIVTQHVVQPIRTATWEDSKARIVQLMKNRDHFEDIASFYNNLENMILPTIQTDQVSDEARQIFLLGKLPDMQEQAQEIRDVIHTYIPPTQVKYKSDLPEGLQKLEN
jgi:hypothetical protein